MYTLDEFNETMAKLEAGELRVAEKINGEWVVNKEIKEIILAGFRLGRLADMSCGEFSFIDKDTYPTRKFSPGDKLRIVPGGTTVRRGAYLAPSTVVMPPSYINVGAYVGEDTMIDSHALVGSCAQVGCHVHLSAASQLGGVLEPVGALPVIIEDNVFVGGNCGIYEGVIVKEYAVIATGVIINSSTPLYDATKADFVARDKQGRVVVPEGAVVVAGSRQIAHGPAAGTGVQLYTPVIVKYRDDKTEMSLQLENLLR